MAEPTYADLTQTAEEIQAILDTAVVTSGESSVPRVFSTDMGAVWQR